MKVFVLAILLVSICCLEGALVKRQAEAQSEVAALQEKLQQYAQSMSQYFSSELLAEEKIEQLKAHGQTFVQQAQEHLQPWADQMRDSLTQLFTTLQESVKKATS
ncbi:apolipoprotein A-II [Sceloporus undulatus]|uniref:apolipoprotein A-II n=1 Tax=Sceloporus undulatus TaxID=8520 RepID=UPI001C4B2990|nr:apolipoprotein A-II [Sceloporus undulatus]